MITRRGTGKVRSINSMPPRIHLGAVTSTFRDVARAMRLICEANTLPNSTPARAETPQLPARTQRLRVPCKRSVGRTNGSEKPSTNANTTPAA